MHRNDVLLGQDFSGLYYKHITILNDNSRVLNRGITFAIIIDDPGVG